MQFHLNGFVPGDPDAPGRMEVPGARLKLREATTEVDVLIIGSGPTGLTLAAQLSQFPKIHTRLVEQKAGPLQVGQADGLACRTLEMFQAFGFAERVLREAYWVNETCFWQPDERNTADIVRGRVIQDVEEGLSEFPHVILNQARIHDFYLELIRNAPAPVHPEYSTRLISLQVDERLRTDLMAYPIVATLQSADPSKNDLTDSVRARFVIGCDGAHSMVRQLIGRSLDGDSASQAWGVMDVLAITDFPDIRRKSVIHSASEGSMLIIPREGGYLVRFYIELDKLKAGQRVSSLDMTRERLIAAAQRILKPFTLVVKEVVWWSVYEIGQRVCERFDDIRDSSPEGTVPRVFLAGDACHTHSPKAGQGMNVSMQDAFNLGWKLAAVIRRQIAPDVLTTYSAERQEIARELIEFDRTFAQMFSARPKTSTDPGPGIDPREFQAHFMRAGRFTAGVATRYQASRLTGESTYQELAQGLVIGTRLHSCAVIRLADAKPMHLGHLFRADGRWRILAFAGNYLPSDRSASLWALCDFLERSSESPIRRYTASTGDIDSVIELIAICQQPHRTLSVDSMPPMLLPRKGRFGLIDYEKVFCPDVSTEKNIFDARAVNREKGALIIVRPDQYIGHVLPLQAHAEIAGYFARCMRSEH